MSAAAGPKRWGVSRQARGREFDPTENELFTLLTLQGACSEGYLGRQKEKEMIIINGQRLMDQNWSRPRTFHLTSPYLILIILYRVVQYCNTYIE
jgi:hypothetical protein